MNLIYSLSLPHFRLILYFNNKTALRKVCPVLVFCILSSDCHQMKMYVIILAMILPYFITLVTQFYTQLHLSSLSGHIQSNIDQLSSTFSFSLFLCFSFYPEILNCFKLKTQYFTESMSLLIFLFYLK